MSEWGKLFISSPSFNNNEFSDGVSLKKWNKLLADEFNPLLNRCIAGLYSPGSTYKLVTALHAIENQKFNKNKKFYALGMYLLEIENFIVGRKKVMDM